jgi:hypothetical protein
MNAQRWLALGIFALVVLCIATSNLWLARLRGNDEQTTPTPSPQPTLATGTEEATPPPGAPTREPTATPNPIIAELIALATQPLGVGDEPFIIMAGDFTTIDIMHQAQGTASIYQMGDVQRILRLDPFTVSNGPDLHVILSQHAQPRTSAEALLPDYVDLGILRSITGAQNYPIPDNTDLTRYRSVVIYSMSLNMVYSTATLTEVRGQR